MPDGVRLVVGYTTQDHVVGWVPPGAHAGLWNPGNAGQSWTEPGRLKLGAPARPVELALFSPASSGSCHGGESGGVVSTRRGVAKHQRSQSTDSMSQKGAAARPPVTGMQKPWAATIARKVMCTPA